MALDPSTAPSLTAFKLLSFDIYGTLVDWYTGISNALAPLVSRLPSTHPAKSSRETGLQAFERYEGSIKKANPGMLYSAIFVQVYHEIASEWSIVVKPGEAEAFGASIGGFPPFSDTVAAVQTLGKYYKLVPLSNVDRHSFARTLAGPLSGIRFDTYYTAEDIGSYKPDHRNFEYLLRNVEMEFGVQKEELLHVAQSIWHDHMPAKEMGLWSAWIARGNPAEQKGYEGVPEDLKGRASFQWRWPTLGDMARDVVAEFEKEGKRQKSA
ncbi:hypothetical protein MMC12_000571 [Toensbergia leucococca]|nr:hypothetical protein [Toensbergia leucococca]